VLLYLPIIHSRRMCNALATTSAVAAISAAVMDMGDGVTGMVLAGAGDTAGGGTADGVDLLWTAMRPQSVGQVVCR
jgi:hypothetical protein